MIFRRPFFFLLDDSLLFLSSSFLSWVASFLSWSEALAASEPAGGAFDAVDDASGLGAFSELA